MADWFEQTVVLLVGLVVLTVGGEWLVRGAGRLARLLGVSPLVVGLTVVAFGTSAPEAAVTIFAAIQGAPDLAVGNVVGSNIANVLLILGLAALIQTLDVSRNLIRTDGPVMLATAAILAVLAWGPQRIDRAVGLVLVMGLVAYTLYTYFVGRRETQGLSPHLPPLTGWGRHAWYNVLCVLLGIGALVGGARLIVVGATALAAAVGISDHVIGLTIVAVGTSLPELATTVVAARHKEPDIAIGNVVGSNIFNVLFVTGLAAVVRPLPIGAALVRFDVPVMLLVSIVGYIMLCTGRRVTRGEGFVLLAGYAAYLLWTGTHARVI